MRVHPVVVHCPSVTWVAGVHHGNPSGPLILAVVWLVKAGGEQFYIYVWAFSQIVLFVFMWIYPNFIQPRFNKYEPLQDDELRTKIEELASSEEFPLTRLYQVDGSKRSGHSNAYCYGFGKNKRIVVFDTLLTQPHDEILAVLLHELGHWKFMHVLTSLAINSMHMFLLLWTFSIVVFSEEGARSEILPVSRFLMLRAQPAGCVDCNSTELRLQRQGGHPQPHSVHNSHRTHGVGGGSRHDDKE